MSHTTPPPFSQGKTPKEVVSIHGIGSFSCFLIHVKVGWCTLRGVSSFNECGRTPEFTSTFRIVHARLDVSVCGLLLASSSSCCCRSRLRCCCQSVGDNTVLVRPGFFLTISCDVHLDRVLLLCCSSPNVATLPSARHTPRASCPPGSSSAASAEATICSSAACARQDVCQCARLSFEPFGLYSKT